MRQLATIRKISDIRPIENADKIEVAQIDGWECVIKKGEFAVGDLAVYIEIDSIVPERPEFEFLRDRKFRVKTIKLRRQISQGLAMPVSILPIGNYKLGDDVTDILGIKKHDPQAEQERLLRQNDKKRSPLVRWLMKFSIFRKLFFKSKRRGGFPEWIVKTDQERIQNKTIMFEKEKANGTKFVVTEKLDGQSATYFLKKVGRKKFEFGVCSRNVYLGKPDSSSYWTIAKQLNIEKALLALIGDHDSIVLQGEIIGSGIQGNKYKVSGYDFYAFDLIYPTGKVSYHQMLNSLMNFEIKSVPYIESAFQLKDTIAEMVDYAKGNSKLLRSQKREGLVWRCSKPNISFKVINPEFLLATEE